MAERIRVTGIVQGVGFRPNVWRLAKVHGITGNVRNDAEGVLIEAWGNGKALSNFVLGLEQEAPPLARIDSILRVPLHTIDDKPALFSIAESRDGISRTGVPADAATCPQCLAEIMQPRDRRYRYPFTNCTRCGPRLSIIQAIPYDRANTSMSVFKMCATCQMEYENPADRRFHAQPNACPECGPRLWLENGQGRRMECDPAYDAIETAARLIRAGNIVAVKGIGGIHLAVDAGNEQAVAALRERKQRYHKAFALMARDVTMVERYASVNDTELKLLQDHAAPIVVLNARGAALADGVAPRQNSLGFMLPYTALHHLLMLNMQGPIVLTSGNRSDEPQVINNDDARKRLHGIADYFLLHDRDIVNRLDDSVLRVTAGKPRMLRRARGYAAQSVRMPEGFEGGPPILAMGADLKNTFSLLQNGQAIISQHLGDLEDATTQEDYRSKLRLYRELFDFEPQVIAVDKHPNYHSSRLGRAIAEEEGLRLIEVQHHHAHIVACLAEHGLPLDMPKVLGVALDGLGYGEDGTLWGGEFLLADYHGFERLMNFQPVPMLGGNQAAREPWRSTFAHLDVAIGWERVTAKYGNLDIVRFLENKPLATLQTMAAKGINSPRASSAGRLFDAVAAALGICRERAGYEGQTGLELEALAASEIKRQAGYDYEIQGTSLAWTPLWQAVLRDLAAGETPAVIAARFHNGLADAIAEAARGLCERCDTHTVVISGGVSQNSLLFEGLDESLRKSGLRVLSPNILPANDGGVSFGQVAAGRGTTA